MKTLLLFIFSSVTATAFSQVGIGTTNPQETLHIEGNLIVEGQSIVEDATNLVGADDLGNLTTLEVNNTLVLENNSVQLSSAILYEIGRMNLSGLVPSPGNLVHDVDLFLKPGEANQGKTVIIMSNLPSNLKITGIQGGSNGMHLFIYNSSTANIVFLDESDKTTDDSAPENRIKVLAGSETISGRGSIELFYDAAIQRWLFLSIHD